MQSKPGGTHTNKRSGIIDPFRAQIIRELAISFFASTFAMAYKYLRREDLAFEVVSDAFYMLMIMEQEPFDKIKHLDRYLLRMVTYGAWNLQKKECKYHPIIDGIDTNWSEEENFFYRIFIKKDPTAEVEKLLSHLSQENARYAQILRLYYLEALSHKEIAETMKISLTNSKQLLKRAKAAYKKLYEDWHPDDDPGSRRGGILSIERESKQCGSGNAGKCPDGTTTLDYTIGDHQRLKRLRIEDVINEEPFHRPIIEGCNMLLEDFGNKENVQQMLKDKMEQLLDGFFAHAHSVSDETNDGSEESNNSNRKFSGTGEDAESTSGKESNPRILIVDDDEAFHEEMRLAFKHSSVFEEAIEVSQLENKLKEGSEFDLVLLDLELDTAVPENMIRLELIDYLKKERPYRPITMEHIWRTLKTVSDEPGLNVLITGEAGVGKSIAARFLHNNNQTRWDNPFEDTLTSNIPKDLIESPLFGAKKGSLTGATQDIPSRRHLADKGIVFLDEIGNPYLEARSKLLQLLQTKAIHTIRAEQEVTLDAQIIAATNKNLREEVSKGSFRENLYQRLRVFPIDATPWRVRLEHMLALRLYLMGLPSKEELAEPLDRDGWYLLPEDYNYHWVGNVRELQNTVKDIQLRKKVFRVQKTNRQCLPDELRNHKLIFSTRKRGGGKITCELLQVLGLFHKQLPGNIGSKYLRGLYYRREPHAVLDFLNLWDCDISRNTVRNFYDSGYTVALPFLKNGFDELVLCTKIDELNNWKGWEKGFYYESNSFDPFLFMDHTARKGEGWCNGASNDSCNHFLSIANLKPKFKITEFSVYSYTRFPVYQSVEFSVHLAHLARPTFFYHSPQPTLRFFSSEECSSGLWKEKEPYCWDMNWDINVDSTLDRDGNIHLIISGNNEDEVPLKALFPVEEFVSEVEGCVSIIPTSTQIARQERYGVFSKAGSIDHDLPPLDTKLEMTELNSTTHLCEVPIPSLA